MHTHPRRQVQSLLGGHDRVDGSPRRPEHRAHLVPRVLEHTAPTRLNSRAQHLVMGRQRHRHTGTVRLPTPRRTLNISQEKCQSTRRSVPHPTKHASVPVGWPRRPNHHTGWHVHRAPPRRPEGPRRPPRPGASLEHRVCRLEA